ncbi:hypothetical protein [Nocardia brasiliensis]|uniref:hypothetical protein n=1 Tax=Nocardia brasiliensis TaxID=37326 RepID=UPI00245833C9|nr:hypothetical protein [Nocardia brasiliensis]
MNTIIYCSHDPAAVRPVVVICVPHAETSHGVIQFVTRTSKPVQGGIGHPADRSLHLDREGIFSRLASAERRLWTPQNVERLGVLNDPYLYRVLERFS